MKVFIPLIEIELYDSIQELPAALETKMQGYLLEDMGVGNTPHQLLKHITNAVQLFDKQPNQAKTEMENALYCYHNALENYDARKLAWACLIRSINGEKLADHSETRLKELIVHLSDNGLTAETIEDTLETVKKNLKQSWSIISPLEEMENALIYNNMPV
jgi:hypothetical protein